MLTVLQEYIGQYGYIIIFSVVFMQEIGIPGFPNEVILLYFGMLCQQHVLLLPIVLVIVILADISGTFLVYTLFYRYKPFLIKLKPTWLKLPSEKIDALTNSIQQRGLSFLLSYLS